MRIEDSLSRCWDVSLTEPMKVEYHDYEWGTPTRSESRLFEFLSLSGMQAGLSWWTVWLRRQAFRNQFDNFDPTKIAEYDSAKLKMMLTDKVLIRNKVKLAAIVNNANAICNLNPDFRNFSEYLWSFVDDQPVINSWQEGAKIPTITPLAKVISKDLISRGFKFVGPTIVYAYIQSVGLVNDHYIGCFRHGTLPFDSIHPKLPERENEWGLRHALG